MLTDRVRVVLVSPRNPLNIGAAARAMSNFGFTHLRVVNPYHIAYHEAKSAVKASAVLEASEQFETLAEAVADCGTVVGTTAVGHRELQHPLRRLETGGEIIRESAQRALVALVFGSEKFGLSNDDLSHCHWLLRIPAREEHGSMNLGQAVAVCLYELIRDQQSAAAQPTTHRPASSADVDRLASLWFAALSASGYVPGRTEASSENKLRRLVVRLQLSERDVRIWLGMLRQILWKLDNP
jgi:tRNA/rRNA methyltransferase